MADSIAWPLGKLLLKTSRRCGTIVGRGRLNACFIAVSTSSPLNDVTATNRAVRIRCCSNRNPITASTTRARTVGPPIAVRYLSKISSGFGPADAGVTMSSGSSGGHSVITS